MTKYKIEKVVAEDTRWELFVKYSFLPFWIRLDYYFSESLAKLKLGQLLRKKVKAVRTTTYEVEIDKDTPPCKITTEA